MREKAKRNVGPLLRNESSRLGAVPWPPPGPPLFRANGHLDLGEDTYGVQARRCEKLKMDAKRGESETDYAEPPAASSLTGQPLRPLR